MRLVVLIGLVLTCSFWSTAQADAQEHATDRGSFIIGGSAGLTSQRIADVRTYYAYLNPNLQYFVRPGLAIGGTASFSRRGYEGEAWSAYGAGPQISLYGGGIGQELRPYASARAVVSDISFADNGILTYGGSAGALYLITHGVGVDASFFYERTSQLGNRSPSEPSDEFGLAVGISAFVF